VIVTVLVSVPTAIVLLSALTEMVRLSAITVIFLESGVVGGVAAVLARKLRVRPGVPCT